MSCSPRRPDVMVAGYEIWAMQAIALYESQLRTVDYLSYIKGWCVCAPFIHRFPQRDVAVEAYIALPCKDYCDLVRRWVVICQGRHPPARLTGELVALALGLRVGSGMVSDELASRAGLSTYGRLEAGFGPRVSHEGV
jgi:hypothetical protein